MTGLGSEVDENKEIMNLLASLDDLGPVDSTDATEDEDTGETAEIDAGDETENEETINDTGDDSEEEESI